MIKHEWVWSETGAWLSFPEWTFVGLITLFDQLVFALIILLTLNEVWYSTLTYAKVIYIPTEFESDINSCDYDGFLNIILISALPLMKIYKKSLDMLNNELKLLNCCEMNW